MRMIRGLMVAFLASAAAAMVYGQGMIMQWQAQIPQTGGNFYYPVSCQSTSDRYRDSSLYDYNGDGVLDIIQTIDIYEPIKNLNFIGKFHLGATKNYYLNGYLIKSFMSMCHNKSFLMV